jgi:DNA mismatch repair protein MutL
MVPNQQHTCKGIGMQIDSNGLQSQWIPKIELLERSVVDLIKAGEVVERPLSIVKECVENSCDAGATQICIELVDAGKKLIRISDNGSGIQKEDLRIAFERHSTSKLRQFSDLEELATYGFRGEALSSIGAVSELHIHSRTRNQQVGFKLIQNFGEFETQEPSHFAMNVGTIIECHNLFEKFPVRSKFLKTNATEFSNICEFLNAISFLYPSIHFSLIHNNREIFAYRSADSLQLRFNEIAGGTAQQFRFFEDSRNSMTCSGFLQLPEHAQSISKLFYVFVNGRFVVDKLIKNAVVQAYEGFALKGQNPCAVVFLQIPQKLVDVNVHPSKTQVRFFDGLYVQDFIFQSVRDALRTQIQKEFNPTVANIINKAEPSSKVQKVVTEQFFANQTQLPKDEKNSSLRALSLHLDSFQNVKEQAAASDTQTVIQRTNRTHENTSQVSEVQTAPRYVAENLLVQEPLSNFLQGATYVGQIQKCYLMFDAVDAFYAVDQHAFHERILHEKLIRSLKVGNLARQQLLAPLLLPLPRELEAHKVELIAFLETVGFDGEWLSNGPQIAVHSLPAFVQSAKAIHLLNECCVRFAASLPALYETNHPFIKTTSSFIETVNTNLSVESVFHLSAATIACHSAVRSGDALTSQEVHKLISDSFEVDFSAHCPHGRKVYKRFSKSEMAEWFFRI